MGIFMLHFSLLLRVQLPLHLSHIKLLFSVYLGILSRSRVHQHYVVFSGALQLAYLHCGWHSGRFFANATLPLASLPTSYLPSVLSLTALAKSEIFSTLLHFRHFFRLSLTYLGLSRGTQIVSLALLNLFTKILLVVQNFNIALKKAILKLLHFALAFPVDFICI